MSDAELRKFFEFNEADLTANRAGRLSEKQNKRLKEAEQGANQILRWAGVFFILLAGGVSMFFLFQAWKMAWADLAGIVFALGFVWAVCGGFAFGAFRLASSKLDHSVQKAEGKVNFVKVEKQVRNPSNSASPYRTEQQYELRVGRLAFEDVDEELLNLIEEGDIYAFYYAKDSKDILSCEFISKGK